MMKFDLNNWISWKPKIDNKFSNYENYSGIPSKLLLWKDIVSYPESFWYIINRIMKGRRKKVYFTKCSNRTLTTAEVLYNYNAQKARFGY